MGYSMTQAASRTLNKISDHCYENFGSQNTYTINDRKFFFEASRRDQVDGGVCGSINEMVLGKTLSHKWANLKPEGEYSIKKGTFKINGEGKMIRGPKYLKEILKEIFSFSGLVTGHH